MSTVIRLGNLIIEPALGEAQIGACPVRLTHTQYLLLTLLASRPNRVWSRDELRTSLGLRSNHPSGLTVHIARLRKKLVGSEPLTIVTIRKRGYTLAPLGTGADSQPAVQPKEVLANAEPPR